jgi:hypothetical protein
LAEIDAMPQSHLVLFCAYYAIKADREEERQLLAQLHSQMRR